MDKTIVTSPEKRNDTSSFGGLDASHIDSAVRALRRSGDIVLIEAQHRALRDHYVKQILALMFSVSPEVRVNRCSKDRDWLIENINQAFIKHEKLGDKPDQGKICEVWIVDLNNTEDFELLRLAQKLVTQFLDAGICMLVSCSPSLTQLPEFSKWINRIGIPLWKFELPDQVAMNEFLEKEARAGAINEARKLVQELKISKPDDSPKLEEAELYNLMPMFGPKDSKMEYSVPESDPPLFMREDVSHDLKNDLDRKKASFDIQSTPPKASNSTTASPKSMKENKWWTRLRLVGFSMFLLTLSLIFVAIILGDTNLSKIYMKVTDLYAVALTQPEQTPLLSDAEPPLQSENKTADVVTTDTHSVADSSRTKREIPNEISAESLNTGSKSGFTPGDNLEREVVSTSVTEPISGVSNSQSDANLDQKLGNSANDDFTPDLKTYSQNEILSDQYFAQLGAFGSRNAAVMWQITNAKSLSDTFVERKGEKRWVVLNGPFKSREIAKTTLSKVGIDFYVIAGSDLINR